MVWMLGEEGKSLGLTPRTPETKVWAGPGHQIPDSSSGYLRESLMFSIRQTPVPILALPHSS